MLYIEVKSVESIFKSTMVKDFFLLSLIKKLISVIQSEDINCEIQEGTDKV